MTLIFVGGGLGQPYHLTLEAVEVLREADRVYVDIYTGMVDESFLEFVRTVSKVGVEPADRHMLEENNARIVAEAAEKEVALVIPGESFIATTHSSLREKAVKHGVNTRLVHGISAYTSAISLSGLHVYKFGRAATIPVTENPVDLRTVYFTVHENSLRGLHTFLFLDTVRGGLDASKALRMLLASESEFRRGVFREDRLAVVVARVGYPDALLQVGPASSMSEGALPPPPHALILPGQLHFTEKEILKLYERNVGSVEAHRLPQQDRERVRGYAERCRGVIKILRQSELKPSFVDHVESYLEDSLRFLDTDDLTNSLLTMGYVEGLLDAVRLLGVVSFEW